MEMTETRLHGQRKCFVWNQKPQTATLKVFLFSKDIRLSQLETVALLGFLGKVYHVDSRTLKVNVFQKKILRLTQPTEFMNKI